jgi:hypothetical protein
LTTSTFFGAVDFLAAAQLFVVPSFLLSLSLAALVALAVFHIKGWVTSVCLSSVFVNAMAMSPSESSSSESKHFMTSVIFSLALPLVDILFMGSLVVDMARIAGLTAKHLVAIEFEAPGFC